MIKIINIEYNEDLCGFVCALNDGREVNVQFEENTNSLDANEYFLDTRYCNDNVNLTDAERTEVEYQAEQFTEIQEWIDKQLTETE